MKKAVFIFFTFLLLLTSSCIKSDDNYELVIMVMDEAGSPVEDASVELYFDPAIKGLEGIYYKTYTNNQGNAKFPNLKEDFYSWRAYKGCLSSEFASNKTTEIKLIKGYANSAICRIEETSFIVLKSNSSFTNRIFLNGVERFEMDTKTTNTITVPASNNKIRVVQNKFLELHPKDTTYNITTTCGEIKILEFE